MPRVSDRVAGAAPEASGTGVEMGILAKGLLSPRFGVTEHGREVAVIECASLRERAKLQVGGARYTMCGKGFFQGDFVLEGDGRTLAAAARTGVFRCSYRVRAGDRQLTLRPGSFFGRVYRLWHGDRPVGSIRRTGLFRLDAAAEFPSDLPLEIRVFLAFLVLMAWRRQARSGGGG
ncbi:MAG: hypothetical protein HY703_06135 [Gemmatimonadetes bacterium]|nr:hypothetical protein [Gemmatimonadota bacterium]